MLTFDRYINRIEIVKKIISIRCKRAESLSKRMTLNNTVKSKSLQKITLSEEDSFIYSLFPPRKEWCHLGKTERKNTALKDRTSKCLWLTYLHANNEMTKPEWLLRLNNFSDNLIKLKNSKNPFAKPNVFAIKKTIKNDTIICRPVCDFLLTSRILLSLFNRFLTRLFDEYFYDCSYAFRLSRSDSKSKFQHIKAINDIKDFRQSETGSLFVAECDMQKFYDTLDHKIIKKRFCIMLQKMIRDSKISNEDAKISKKWFWCYLDNFSFFHDVYSLNRQQQHKAWSGINKKGPKKFDWVESELKDRLISLNNGSTRGVNRHLRHLKLGVPQGGAISGFIANLMMHYVDMSLDYYIKKKNDFRYIRFCDDMIMIGRNKSDVVEAFDVYKDSIFKSHLFAHKDEKQNPLKMNSFWKGKSRSTYEWGAPKRGVFPWVTFVGFDINWEGNLRIRKSSYRKEIRKQYEKFKELKKLIHGNIPKYGKISLEKFTKRRLVCMSVGSVSMWNFIDFSNEYSWMSAFSVLDNNQWSRKQMKSLDRHRYKVISHTRRMLNELDYHGAAHKVMLKDELHEKEEIYYGKPFSYYGQCFGYK